MTPYEPGDDVDRLVEELRRAVNATCRALPANDSYLGRKGEVWRVKERLREATRAVAARLREATRGE